MTPLCPRCRSSHIATCNHARKAGGTIGAVAGAASSFSCVLKGAQVGNRIGMMTGPAGMAIGTVAGAILGGLIGGAAGCSAGIALGQLIDDNLLANYRCLDCRYTFEHTSSISSPYPAVHTESEEQWFTASDSGKSFHDRHF